MYDHKGCIICHGKIGDCECVKGWILRMDTNLNKSKIEVQN